MFYGTELLTIETLANGGNVVHLHGSVRSPTTMILTTAQYLRHYRERAVQLFLDELFGRYTVLFVGYGLDEDDILEHVFRKQPDSGEQRHFRLFPRYSHQDLLARHFSAYSLKHCGAELVEYCIDRHGYVQLEAVVAAWSRELQPEVRGQLYLEKIKIIDRALDG